MIHKLPLVLYTTLHLLGSPDVDEDKIYKNICNAQLGKSIYTNSVDFSKGVPDKFSLPSSDALYTFDYSSGKIDSKAGKSPKHKIYALENDADPYLIQELIDSAYSQLFEDGDYWGAIETSKKALQTNSSANALALHGLALLKWSSLEEGIKYLKRALEIDENNPYANLGMGIYKRQTAITDQDLDTSAYFLVNAVDPKSANPEVNEEAVKEMGRVHCDLGMYSLAYFDFMTVLAENESDSSAFDAAMYCKWKDQASKKFPDLEKQIFEKYVFSVNLNKEEMTIPAKVIENEKSMEIDLIFDTGCISNMIINAKSAEELGVKQDHIFRIRDKSQYVILDTIKIGELTVTHVPVTIIDDWYKNSSLGLGILGKMLWSIDLSNNLITFYDPSKTSLDDIIEDNQREYNFNEQVVIQAHKAGGHLKIPLSFAGVKSDKWIVDTGYKGMVSFDVNDFKDFLSAFDCKPFGISETPGGLKAAHFCKSMPNEVYIYDVDGKSYNLNTSKFGKAYDYSRGEKTIKENIQGSLGINAFSNYKYIIFDNSTKRIILQR